MAKTLVESSKQGRVAIITLNDPDRRNALSDPLVDGLIAAVTAANQDETIHAAVLTGVGVDFCSGGNVKDMYHRSGGMFEGTPAQMQDSYRQIIQRIPRLFNTIDLPMVAAVHGNALGAGLDLTCMCDIRIATPDAAFAESFARVGLISGDGGAWYLPRILGVSRALEMALTCNLISGETAAAWGFVSRVVPKESLLDEAIAIADRIASFPRQSMRLNKRLVRQSAELGLNDALEIAAAYQSIIQHTADQREAVSALIEKRPPTYTGS